MGRKPKYHVVLEPDEAAALRQVIDGGGACRTVQQRCRVLLEADEARESWPGRAAVARRAGVCTLTVTSVISLYAEGGLDAVLHLKRSPRSDRSRCKVNEEIRESVIRLASSPPPAGRSRWTLRILAEHSVEHLGIQLSKDTIRNILRNQA